MVGFQQFKRFSLAHYCARRQGFSDLKCTRCSEIGRICRSRVFLKGYKNLILHDAARRCGAEGLVSCTFPAIFGARGTPEAVQNVIPGALYPLALTVYHPVSSDYLISLEAVPRSCRLITFALRQSGSALVVEPAPYFDGAWLLIIQSRGISSNSRNFTTATLTVKLYSLAWLFREIVNNTFRKSRYFSIIAYRLYLGPVFRAPGANGPHPPVWRVRPSR